MSGSRLLTAVRRRQIPGRRWVRCSSVGSRPLAAAADPFMIECLFISGLPIFASDLAAIREGEQQVDSHDPGKDDSSGLVSSCPSAMRRYVTATADAARVLRQALPGCNG